MEREAVAQLVRAYMTFRIQNSSRQANVAVTGGRDGQNLLCTIHGEAILVSFLALFGTHIRHLFGTEIIYQLERKWYEIDNKIG